MRHRLCVILVSLVLLFSFCIPAFAFEEPDNCYYIILNTASEGRLKVFIPYNYAKYFSTSDNGSSVVNTTSSTVTCYATDTDGVVYNIRFPSFDIPNYRRADLTGGSYVTLYVNSVGASNVPFLNDTDFGIFNHTALVNMCSLLLIGFICLICIMRL